MRAWTPLPWRARWGLTAFLNLRAGLLSRPRLLLLDEPTSGLDSFAAAVVMRHVADLAAGPARVAVVASLHQPRAAIWDMVDQVRKARNRVRHDGTGGSERLCSVHST